MVYSLISRSFILEKERVETQDERSLGEWEKGRRREGETY
jgi:hypothetical protein